MEAEPFADLDKPGKKSLHRILNIIIHLVNHERGQLINDFIFSEKGITRIIGDYLGNSPLLSDEEYNRILSRLLFLNPCQVEGVMNILQQSQYIKVEEYLSETDIIEYLQESTTDNVDENGNNVDVKTSFTQEEMSDILKEVSECDVINIQEEIEMDSMVDCYIYGLAQLISKKGSDCNRIIIKREEEDE